MTLLSRFRTWLDDQRGLCRLCRRGDVPLSRGWVEPVVRLETFDAPYHRACAIASVEARVLYRAVAKLERTL